MLILFWAHKMCELYHLTEPGCNPDLINAKMCVYSEHHIQINFLIHVKRALACEIWKPNVPFTWVHRFKYDTVSVIDY